MTDTEFDDLFQAYMGGTLAAEQGNDLLASLNEPQWRARLRRLAALEGALSEHFPRSPKIERRWTGLFSRWNPRRMIPAVGMMAAIVALTVLLPLLQFNGSRTHAEEAVTGTAKRILAANGLMARFKCSIIEHNGAEKTERTATGEIKYAGLSRGPFVYRCDEIWAARGDEPEVKRSMGQTTAGRWHREKQGDSTTGGTTSVKVRLEALVDENAPGVLSPIDLRTSGAVFGLAALMRSFAEHKFLHWMGYQWRLQSGVGSAERPWVYTSTPETGDSAPPANDNGDHDRLEWTLTAIANDDGVIQKIALKEIVRAADGKSVRSEFSAEYELEIRDNDWPGDTFTPLVPIYATPDDEDNPGARDL